jgi:hypothetical protein
MEEIGLRLNIQIKIRHTIAKNSFLFILIDIILMVALSSYLITQRHLKSKKFRIMRKRFNIYSKSKLM